MTGPEPYDAVVLAGGASRRFGGVDKATVVLDGVPLLDRVLTATSSAAATVVVGPVRTTARPVTWTAEDPPSGGPVAGIAAGLVPGTMPIVVVASCDLPWLTATEVSRLVADIGRYDGLGLTDPTGRPQPLAAAYRRTALEAALTALGDPRDRSVRGLLAHLDLHWTEPTAAARDVDTWSDLDR